MNDAGNQPTGQRPSLSNSSADTLRQRDQKLIVGRLLEHGKATYQFRTQEAESYFLKLLTQRGERVLWGKDLERAITTSATQPKLGDMIGARRIAREAVTIMTQQRDATGKVLSQSGQLAHRNRWVVEKVQFFTERAKLARRVRDSQSDARRDVKAHPELMSTYLTLRGAQEIAEQRIADPQDRERFVALVREAIAGSIKKGEPMPAMRMRKLQRSEEIESSISPPQKQTNGQTR